MTSLKELEVYGRSWRVSQPITAGLDIPIVTPEDYLAGPVNIGNQQTVARRGGITILGIAASIVSTGAGSSVTLRSQDPMYVDGQINDYDIWSLRATSGTNAQQSVNCAWTLSPANYRTSPQGSGAILELVAGTNVTGFITVWGIYGQADIGGVKAFSGSPADFNS